MGTQWIFHEVWTEFLNTIIMKLGQVVFKKWVHTSQETQVSVPKTSQLMNRCLLRVLYEIYN
jgi:hypothetical protein